MNFIICYPKYLILSVLVSLSIFAFAKPMQTKPKPALPAESSKSVRTRYDNPPKDTTVKEIGNLNKEGKTGVVDIDGNAIHNVLDVTLSSSMIQPLRLIMLFLGGLFWLISAINIVKSVMIQHKPLQEVQLVQSFIVLIVLLLYTSILDNLIHPLFWTMFTWLEDSITTPQSINNAIKNMSPGEESTKISLFSVQALFAGIAIKLINLVLKAVDYIFYMYAYINIFIMEIFGCVSVGLSLLPGLQKSLLIWIMNYMKYWMYYAVIVVSIAFTTKMIAIIYMSGSKADNPITIAADIAALGAKLNPTVFLYCLLFSLIAKVLFILTGFKVIDSIFSNVGGNMEGGIGRMIGELTKNAVKATTGKFN